MKSFLTTVTELAAAGVFLIGCQSQTEPVTSNAASPPAGEVNGLDHSDEAHDDHGDPDVEAEMAKLSPEDRKEAEAQKFCVVSDGSLLGSMGPPIKLEINGLSVFICCGGCKSSAMKAPEKTLATVAKLKAENSEVAK